MRSTANSLPCLLHSPCDLCGTLFRQYVVDRPRRVLCPGCQYEQTRVFEGAAAAAKVLAS